MNYKIVRLGDHIQRITEKNSDDKFDYLVGISEQKVFREPSGKVNRENLSNHLLINKDEFAYIPRMNPFKPLAVALSEYTHTILLSPSYAAFRIIDTSILLPKYLQLFFNRKEFDRYAAFHAWSSTRDTFDWDKLQDVEIPLPPLEKQREYVAIYSNLLKLSSNHEKSFADLQFITNTFTEKLASQYGTQELGDYIVQTDTRNSDNMLGVKELRGISTSKIFIKSKANTTGVSFSNYKVVKTRQFAYVADTSRRGDKIAIAFNGNGPIIVSSIYTTFEIKDTDKLLPEFLLLWFMRPDFDRYTRYNSWGSARETFDWSEMKRVRIPVPPISVQKSIVAIYHALESRKALNERLKNTIKDISPVLIKDAKDRCMEVAG